MSGVELSASTQNFCFIISIQSTTTSESGGRIGWSSLGWRAPAALVSWQALDEFYQNAVRKMRLDRAAARETVEDLSQRRPMNTSARLIREAWEWRHAAQLSYWDALIFWPLLNAQGHATYCRKTSRKDGALEPSRY
jgi:hypothetical protein